MAGRAVGLSQTGKGVKEKLDRSSIQQENGLEIQMTKACIILWLL